MTDERIDLSRLGLTLVVLGVVSLLTLRLWASPVASRILGRESVSIVLFLGIPFLLLVAGAGIVLFVWGPELIDRVT